MSPWHGTGDHRAPHPGREGREAARGHQVEAAQGAASPQQQETARTRGRGRTSVLLVGRAGVTRTSCQRAPGPDKPGPTTRDAPAAPVAPHVTRTVTSCHPDAPSGAGGATSEVCVRPSASVARTVRRCSPGVASHAYDHCRHVSGPTVAASVAGRHAPSSTRTSTAAIPVCCAQATPATVTGPDGTPAPARGVSTRDASLIGPRSDQPRVDQYATSSANVVTLSSVTHLVADTYPYRPGTTRRAGNPCAGGSGSPFMPTASRHARSGSVSTSSGVLAVHPSALVDSTMSAPSRTPARASSSRTGYPSHRALPTRSPPTSFDTHVSVTSCSTSGSASSSSIPISNGSSTRPVTRSVHVAGSTWGTRSAVSIR